MDRRSPSLLVLFLMGSSLAVTSAQVVYPIEPFYDRVAEETNSSPSPFVFHDGRYYFTADSGFGSRDIWVSDGTVGGTEPFLCLRRNLTLLGVMQDRLVFIQQGPYQRPPHLWQSDGTPSGTTEISLPTLGIEIEDTERTTSAIVAGELYTRNRNELYRSDLTAAGSRLIAEVNFGHIGHIAEFQGKLLYDSAGVIRSYDPATEQINTLLVPGTTSRIETFADRFFTVSQFGGVYTHNGSDGLFLIDFLESPFYPIFARLGDTFFIASWEGLFAWAGEATTFLGPLIVPSDFSYGRGDSRFGAVLEGFLYFTADDGNGTGLWRSDATVAGTEKVMVVSEDSRVEITFDQRVYFTNQNRVWVLSLEVPFSGVSRGKTPQDADLRCLEMVHGVPVPCGRQLV